jgi:hypothetical protein
VAYNGFKMAQALTADDLMPLIARLSSRQRRLLAQRLGHNPMTQEQDHPGDAARYRRQPMQPCETVDSNAGVAFDPEGWDEFYAPR